MFNYTLIFMTIYQKFNQYKKAAENNKNQPPNFIEDYGIRVINDSDPDREEHVIKDKFDLDVIDNNKINSSKALLSNASDRIESSSEDLYKRWLSTKDPNDFNAVLKSLKPTIEYSLSTYQAKGDPYIESKAKLIAAKSIRDFDPEYKVSLPTYVNSQLRKLTRVVRESRSPIKIPERLIYESAELKEAEQEFINKKGREPDVQELSDFSKIPIERIEYIRKKAIKQVSEANYFTADNEGQESQTSVEDTSKEMPNTVREALSYTHANSDHRERKILEWSTGFGGAPILKPADIAKKLNISQSQVSRITAKLAVDVESNLKAIEEALTQ